MDTPMLERIIEQNQLRFEFVDRVVASYEEDARTQHIERTYLPAKDEIISLVNVPVRRKR